MPTPPFIGSEFPVNTTTAGQQQLPSAAGLDTGKFVVVWQDSSATGGDVSSNAVRGQLFNADGSKAGAEFLVNQSTAGSQDSAVVTALADGRFVVAWTDRGSGDDIRARIYNADGSPAGNEFFVNAGFDGSRGAPAIAALANGGFVVTWARLENGDDIEARVFAADGTPLTGDLTIDGGVSLEQDPVVVGLANGNFAVVWNDDGDLNETDGSGTHIRGAIFSTNGTEVVGEFVVNSTTAGNQFTPAIAALPNGDFIVTWGTQGSGGSDVRGRLFTVDGVPLGPDFPIDTDGDFSNNPAVAGLLDGGYTVVWTNETGTGQSINGEVLEGGDGNSQTGEFTVDTTSLVPANATVTRLADGRVLVAWTELLNTPNDPDRGVRAQIIDPRTSGVTLFGTELADEFLGTPFDDSMKGGGGADRFDGAGGDDFLEGGKGADVLIGGAGIDTAAYNLTTSGISVNLATNINTGGDAQGDSLSGIENVNGGNFADAIAGDGKDNVLKAFNGSDGLFGAGGNDVLDGGNGADALNGGDGIDTASYAGAAEAVVLDLRAPSLNTGEAAGDTFVSIERFLGTTFNDRMEGNAADNTFDGSEGNDTLNGNDGNDRLAGGPGADKLNGGAGSDTADYLGETAGVTVDLAAGQAFAGGATDTLTSIERAIGSQFSDALFGTDGDDILDGASGDDVVEGFGGNDRLEGGAGNDRLEGGAGNDELIGQSGIDTADYLSGVGGTGVVVDLRNGTATGGAGTDTLNGIEDVFGSNFADTLHGNDEVNRLEGAGGADILNGNGGGDRLLGGSGNDVITGGLGTDEMLGGSGDDRFVWNVGDGNDEVLGGADVDTFDANGNGSAELFVIFASGGGTVRLNRNAADAEIEFDGVETIDLDTGVGDDVVAVPNLAGTDTSNLRLSLGAGNDVLNAAATNVAITAFGQDGNDLLAAGSGNDTLNGDAGDDTLRGGGGNDTIDGGAGNDRIVGDEGADTLRGGDGIDTVDYLNDFGIRVDLQTGIADNGGSADTISGFERVIGSQFADTLRGNGGDNLFDGAGGDDVIDGFGGNDRLEGGGGNDKLNGGDGNDEVIGQSGKDHLDGANGDDLVRGGEGDDTIEGRDGNDKLEGEAGADTIDAGAGNDLLFGGDGNDRLFAAGGTDTLTGGAGNDQFFYTNTAAGQINGDTITDFQSVAGANTGDTLLIHAGFSGIVFNNGSTAITYGGVTETLFHPGVTLSLANDLLVV